MLYRKIIPIFVAQNKGILIVIKFKKMEFLTTELRKDKNGKEYIYQIIETQEKVNNVWVKNIEWSGKATREDYEWVLDLIETNPERLIDHSKGVLNVIESIMITN